MSKSPNQHMDIESPVERGSRTYMGDNESVAPRIVTNEIITCIYAAV